MFFSTLLERLLSGRARSPEDTAGDRLNSNPLAEAIVRPRNDCGWRTPGRVADRSRLTYNAARFQSPATGSPRRMHDNGPCPGALTGYRALELGGTLGSYCGKLLADLGADVIKAEPPSGCPDRSLPPFWGDAPGAERSLWHLALNTGKRSVTLNAESAEGREALRALASRASAVIDAFPPGYADTIGLGSRDLRSRFPHLIVTSITGFGLDGPYARYKAPDIVGMAMSGLMNSCGYKDMAPSGGHTPFLAIQAAGIRAAEGTLAALWDREATGLGQHVEVSMQEVLSFGLDAQVYSTAFPMAIPPWMKRQGNYRGVITPYPCKDGWILLVWLYHVEKLVELLAEEGMEHDLREQKWLDPTYTVPNQPHVDAIIEAFTTRFTKNEVMQRAQRWGIPAGSLNDSADLYSDPQLQARQFFVPVRHDASNRTIAYPRAPYVMSATPVRTLRAPKLGEHNAEIFSGELGFTAEQLSALRANGAI